ncbi:MAG TPA: glycosyl hydrolase family 28-related protein, partial [Flavisolibacter sp.]|nr:glycosyl hydrolase family 28-related protein [Flavisolibacter sp.]
NSANENEVLVQVPPTTAAVNVALRANALGSMVHYADYNANGTLLLQENVNYPGPADKGSVGVTVHSPGVAKVISIGNKYGLCYDAAPGPFAVSNLTAVQSVGDLWMLPNTTDYSKHFNEPINREAMQVAGKAIPHSVTFLNTSDSVVMALPDLSSYQLATCPRIANLAELMLNVNDFGAVPNDGKDDRIAIQRALDAAEKGGVYEPVYFPAGKYELSEPLFLDHLAGGGFWGDGADRSILVSTSGKGVLTSDGAGYATFVDIGFENKAGAESKTTDFDWINQQSPDKKRGNTGAALQANNFYRDRFENGGIGMAVGYNRMGDGFVIADCVFKNIHTTQGEGAAYASEGFNALTNPLVHCLFDGVDCAVNNTKGSSNFYGNRLRNIRTA